MKDTFDNDGVDGFGFDDRLWPLAQTVKTVLPQLVTLDRVIAQLQARKTQIEADLMAAIYADTKTNSSDMVEQSARYVQAELAAELLKSEATVINSLATSYDLRFKYDATYSLLKKGDISFLHAKAITSAGLKISDPIKRGLFEKEALKLAVKNTPGRFRYLLKLVVGKYIDDAFEKRHEKALRGRYVHVFELDDGMAGLYAVLEASLATGIKNRINQIAKKEHRAQQEALTALNPNISTSTSASADVSDGLGFRKRLLGEIEADVLSDLLLTSQLSNTNCGAYENIKATVQVTIPVDNLINPNSSNSAGYGTKIDGYGPVSVTAVRRLAAAATSWERIFTDPVTGMVVATDSYQPTQNMRRLLAFRDKHCRFPGCRRTLKKCEVDHTKDWARKGPTRLDNLAYLCKSHHRLKHAVFLDKTRWKVTQNSHGTLTWVSPQGRTHTTEPEDLTLYKAQPNNSDQNNSDDCPF